MSEELKPCPFCGGPLRITRKIIEGLLNDKVVERYTSYNIHCMKCGCGTAWHSDLKDAIKNWTRRIK